MGSLPATSSSSTVGQQKNWRQKQQRSDKMKGRNWLTFFQRVGAFLGPRAFVQQMDTFTDGRRRVQSYFDECAPQVLYGTFNAKRVAVTKQNAALNLMQRIHGRKLLPDVVVDQIGRGIPLSNRCHDVYASCFAQVLQTLKTNIAALGKQHSHIDPASRDLTTALAATAEFSETLFNNFANMQHYINTLQTPYDDAADQNMSAVDEAPTADSPSSTSVMPASTPPQAVSPFTAMQSGSDMEIASSDDDRVGNKSPNSPNSHNQWQNFAPPSGNSLFGQQYSPPPFGHVTPGVQTGRFNLGRLSSNYQHPQEIRSPSWHQQEEASASSPSSLNVGGSAIRSLRGAYMDQVPPPVALSSITKTTSPPFSPTEPKPPILTDSSSMRNDVNRPTVRPSSPPTQSSTSNSSEVVVVKDEEDVTGVRRSKKIKVEVICLSDDEDTEIKIVEVKPRAPGFPTIVKPYMVDGYVSLKERRAAKKQQALEEAEKAKEREAAEKLKAVENPPVSPSEEPMLLEDQVTSTTSNEKEKTPTASLSEQQNMGRAQSSQELDDIPSPILSPEPSQESQLNASSLAREQPTSDIEQAIEEQAEEIVLNVEFGSTIVEMEKRGPTSSSTYNKTDKPLRGTKRKTPDHSPPLEAKRRNGGNESSFYSFRRSTPTPPFFLPPPMMLPPHLMMAPPPAPPIMPPAPMFNAIEPAPRPPTNFNGLPSYEEFVASLDPQYEEILLGTTCNFELAPAATKLASDVKARYPEEVRVMSEQIMTHFTNNLQDDDTYNWKMDARTQLREWVCETMKTPGVDLMAVGSTVNGCGSYNSDMDVCICLFHPLHGYDTPRDLAMSFLNQLKMALDKEKPANIKSFQFIDAARVPIIKLMFGPPFDGLEVDLNLNNVAGVYNSHLIHYYSKIDKRFPALALLIKHWAIRAGISDPLAGTFNSYSLILLVLHYLQCGTTPAVLPNLQYLFKDKFSFTAPLTSLELFKKLDAPPMRYENMSSVGELLIGFFHYYANFSFEEKGISIRNGEVFSRSRLPPNMKKFKIFIEEPFDRGNTARCVTSKENFHNIREQFRIALEKLKYAPNLAKIHVKL